MHNRMSAARSLFAHLMAISAAPICVDEIWPGLLSPGARLVTVLIWGSLLVLTLWFAIEEYVSGRRLKACLRAGKGVRAIDTDEE